MVFCINSCTAGFESLDFQVLRRGRPTAGEYGNVCNINYPQTGLTKNFVSCPLSNILLLVKVTIMIETTARKKSCDSVSHEEFSDISIILWSVKYLWVSDITGTQILAGCLDCSVLICITQYELYNFIIDIYIWYSSS